MRILRLTNSSDILPSVPEAERASGVAERLIAELTGETVETVMRVVWPSADLADVVDRWIERFEPDVVFMRAAAFWCSYESVPLKIERHWGPVGKPLARLGLRAADKPTLAHSRTFRAAQRFAARTIGGEPHFEPEEAAGYVEAVFRRVLTRESIVPVMRGPGFPRDSTGTAKGLARARRRNLDLDAALARRCAALHIPYVPADDDVKLFTLAEDSLHTNSAGQRLQGEQEGRAIAAAWLASRSDTATATPANSDA